MQKHSIILLALLTISMPAFSEVIEEANLPTEAKIDSIYRWQKQVYLERNIRPLDGKKYGVEFNFFRPLLYTEFISVSGGFSLFDINRHAEIAFPIYYGEAEMDHGVSEISLDAHYRHFLGNNQKGFYLSGFTRLSRFTGYSEDGTYDTTSYEWTMDYKEKSLHRLGVGVGIGYRIFSRGGLFWGSSLSVGKYLWPKAEYFYEGQYMPFSGSSSDLIVDFELLKFGWAF